MQSLPSGFKSLFSSLMCSMDVDTAVKFSLAVASVGPILANETKPPWKHQLLTVLRIGSTVLRRYTAPMNFTEVILDNNQHASCTSFMSPHKQLFHIFPEPIR